jgi:hypothetical protein
VLGVGKLCLGSFDSLSVDLVGPSTVVSEDSGSLSNVKAFCGSKRLSVVERFKGSENIDISLYQGSNLNEILASLESGAIGSPCGVECLVGTVEGNFDIGG